LPTDETLSLAYHAFGAKALPLLGAWRDAWRRLARDDIDAMAANAHYQGPRRNERALLDAAQIHAIFKTGQIDGPNVEALVEIAGEGLPAARPIAHHVIEDAFVLVSLIEAGLSFDILLPQAGMTHYSAAQNQRGVKKITQIAVSGLRDFRTLLWRQHALLAAAVLPQTCNRVLIDAPTAAYAILVLLDMARQGETRAFLKSARHKDGTYVVEIARVKTYNDAAAAFAHAVGPRLGDFFRNSREGEKTRFHRSAIYSNPIRMPLLCRRRTDRRLQPIRSPIDDL